MKEFLGKGTDLPRTRPYGMLYVCVLKGSAPGIEKRFFDTMLACWEEDGVTELVFEEPHEAAVRDYISTNHPGAEFLWEGKIRYDNWETGKPVVPTHASGFLLCQSWDVVEPAECEQRIILDPGLAFGTGCHPTTQESLSLLRLAFRIQNHETVLAIGCGSGVLSFASILLGARRAYAVDYSLLADNAARKGAKLNGMKENIEIYHDDAMHQLHHPAGLVLCNINYQIIDDFLMHPDVKKREWIIFSGINPEKKHIDFVKKLAAAGREIVECRRRNVWYSYLTEKRS